MMVNQNYNVNLITDKTELLRADTEVREYKNVPACSEGDLGKRKGQ